MVCVKETTAVLWLKDRPDKCTVRAPRLRIHCDMHMQSHGSFRIIIALKSSVLSPVWCYSPVPVEQFHSRLTNNDQFSRLHKLFKYHNLHRVWEEFYQKYQNCKCVHAVLTGWWWDKYKQPLISPFTAKHDDLSQAKSSIGIAFNNKITTGWRQEGSAL